MTNRILLFLDICLIFCVSGTQAVYSQASDANGFPDSKFTIAPDANGFPNAEITAEAYRIFYSIPDGFRYLEKMEALNTHEMTDVGMFYYSFESDDGRCKLFWPMYLPDPFEIDPRYDSKNPPPGFKGYYCLDLAHRNSIMHELRDILDDRVVRFDDYVTVIAGRAPMERFHADSIFSFEIPRFVPILKDAPQFEHGTRMYISRKGMPPIALLWLFTGEGKKNEEYYIRKLDGRIWYDDMYYLKKYQQELDKYLEELP